MRRKSYNIPGHVHFLTFSCYRRCQILTDEGACKLLARSVNAARIACDFELLSYVFMPDHVHMLIRPRRDDYSVAAVLKSIKGPFAKWLMDHWRTRRPDWLRKLTVKTQSGPAVRVWQRGGGFDKNLYSEELIRRAVEYIEWNPVTKKLARDPMDWKWSSARARVGADGAPIQVDPIAWMREDGVLVSSETVAVAHGRDHARGAQVCDLGVTKSHVEQRAASFDGVCPALRDRDQRSRPRQPEE